MGMQAPRKNAARGVGMSCAAIALKACILCLLTRAVLPVPLECPAGSAKLQVDSIQGTPLDWLGEQIYSLRGGNLGVRNFTTTSDVAISPDGSALYIAEVVSVCKAIPNCPCQETELAKIVEEESCPWANAATGVECGFAGITTEECFSRGCCHDETSPRFWCYRRPTRAALMAENNPRVPNCDAIAEAYTTNCHIIFATLNSTRTATILAGGLCSAPFQFFKKIQVLSSAQAGGSHTVLVLDQTKLWQVEAKEFVVTKADVKELLECPGGAFSFAVVESSPEVLVSCGDGLHLVDLASEQTSKLDNIQPPSWLPSLSLPSLSTTPLPSGTSYSFVFDVPPAGGSYPAQRVNLGYMTVAGDLRDSQPTFQQVELAITENTGAGTCARANTPLSSSGFLSRQLGVMRGGAGVGSSSHFGLVLVALGEVCDLAGLPLSGGEAAFRSGGMTIIDAAGPSSETFDFRGEDGNPFRWREGVVGKVTAGGKVLVAVCGGGARGSKDATGVGCANLQAHAVYWRVCRDIPSVREITPEPEPEEEGSNSPVLTCTASVLMGGVCYAKSGTDKGGVATRLWASTIAIIVCSSIAYLCCCYFAGTYVYRRCYPPAPESEEAELNPKETTLSPNILEAPAESANPMEKLGSPAPATPAAKAESVAVAPGTAVSTAELVLASPSHLPLDAKPVSMDLLTSRTVATSNLKVLAPGPLAWVSGTLARLNDLPVPASLAPAVAPPEGSPPTRTVPVTHHGLLASAAATYPLGPDLTPPAKVRPWGRPRQQFDSRGRRVPLGPPLPSAY